MGLVPAGQRPGRRPLASPRSSLCQPSANSSVCYGQGARAPVLSHLTTKNDRILTPELAQDEHEIEAALWGAQNAQARRPKLSYLYTTGAGVNEGMKALFIEPFLFLPKPYTMEQLTKSVAFLLLSANP